MGLVKPGLAYRYALAGRMRHGLRTKYVDACRTSRALVGDYSPKDGGEFAATDPLAQPPDGSFRG